MRKHYQMHSNYGPGGRNCTCCGPSPKNRKSFDRMVKRRERRRSSTEILDQVYESGSPSARSSAC